MSGADWAVFLLIVGSFFAVIVALELMWGPSPKGRRADEGFHSQEERERARANGQKPIPRLSKQELVWTPVEFRDVLVAIARGVSER